MPKRTDVYLLCAYRFNDISTKVCQALEAAGITVYYPYRDTNQADFYNQNLRGLSNAICVVALPGYIGKDFAFELGYAEAKGKAIYWTLAGFPGLDCCDDMLSSTLTSGFFCAGTADLIERLGPGPKKTPLP